jgi:hypothetical protein
MIPANQYPTVQELYDEYDIRFGQLRRAENMDMGSFLRQLNWAIRQTFLQTLPYKSWTYKESLVNLQNGSRLPREFFQAIRVLASETGEDGSFIEARYSDAREYFTITNTVDYPQIWARGRFLSPVYTLWGNRDYLNPLGQPELYLYLQPEAAIAIMDAYIAPQEVSVPLDIVMIPYEFSEYLMLQLASRIQTVIGQLDDAQNTMQMLMRMRQALVQEYTERAAIEKRELSSFVPPVQPLVPTREEPGEYPANKL